MGVAAGEQVHEVAFVKCGGDCEKAKQEYEYHGLSDCTMVNMMADRKPVLMDVLETEAVFRHVRSMRSTL